MRWRTGLCERQGPGPLPRTHRGWMLVLGECRHLSWIAFGSSGSVNSVRVYRPAIPVCTVDLRNAAINMLENQHTQQQQQYSQSYICP